MVHQLDEVTVRVTNVHVVLTSIVARVPALVVLWSAWRSALAGAGVGNLNAAPAEQHGQPATRGGSARLPRRPGGMWRH
jgi:hypothetical protein